MAVLDINLPDLDGLTLAAKLKELNPDILILFLTGYEQYAVDAFQMHASGYLLKPISPERLQSEVDYALRSRPELLLQATPVRRIVVRTFGEFDVFVDGEPVSFSRSRAKELLAYLVDRQGASISRPMAHAVLWEDGTYDRAMQKQLDVIIRSLTSTLRTYGIEEIFDHSGGKMRICPDRFSCDLYSYFKGEIDAVNSYRGEYMSSYSWASLTEAYMNRVNSNL